MRFVVERLRVLAPGGLLVGMIALGVSWLSLHSFFRDPSFSTVVSFVTSVLGAPVFLLRVADERGYLESTTHAAAIVALVAVPAHPILPRDWTGLITIFGLVAWLFCAIIVAGAPA